MHSEAYPEPVAVFPKFANPQTGWRAPQTGGLSPLLMRKHPETAAIPPEVFLSTTTDRPGVVAFVLMVAFLVRALGLTEAAVTLWAFACQSLNRFYGLFDGQSHITNACHARRIA